MILFYQLSKLKRIFNGKKKEKNYTAFIFVVPLFFNDLVRYLISIYITTQIVKQLLSPKGLLMIKAVKN